MFPQSHIYKMLKDTSHDDSVSVPILGQLVCRKISVLVRALSVRNSLLQA